MDIWTFTLHNSLLNLCERLTIKVEEVIVLVDVWPGFWSGSYWANVVFQSRTLLLVSARSPIPTNVQGCSTCGT